MRWRCFRSLPRTGCCRFPTLWKKQTTTMTRNEGFIFALVLDQVTGIGDKLSKSSRSAQNPGQAVIANFHCGLIEPYTESFDPLAPPGSFTDPALPVGYALRKPGTHASPSGLNIEHQCRRGLSLSSDQRQSSSLSPCSFAPCLANASCTLQGT